MGFLDGVAVKGTSKGGLWYRTGNPELEDAKISLKPYVITGMAVRGTIILGVTAACAFSIAYGNMELRFALFTAAASIMLPAIYIIMLLHDKYRFKKSAPALFAAALADGDAMAVNSLVYYQLDGQLQDAGFEGGLREADGRHPFICAAMIMYYLHHCQPHLEVLNDKDAETGAQRDAMKEIVDYAQWTAALIAAFVAFANNDREEEGTTEEGST